MQSGYKLYPWQEDCLQRWQDTGCRGIADVVTGAGKTVFAIYAAMELKKKYPKLRIKIVVPTVVLATQWHASIKQQMGLSADGIGLYHGKRKDDPACPCMIYVINSARNGMAGHILADFAAGHPVLLIADECHHYASLENRKIFEFMPRMKSEDQYFSIGLSATPYPYENSEVLFRGLGPLFYRYDVTAASSQEVVSKFYIANIDVPFSADEMEKYEQITNRIRFFSSKLMKEYPHLKSLTAEHFIKEVRHIASVLEPEGEGAANAYMRLLHARRNMTVLASMRIRCASALVERLEQDTTVLVFCERIVQAEQLYEVLLGKYHSQCSIYHSQLLPEARKRILEDFRGGRIRILISCRCLDEGMDVPDAAVGIVLSSTSATRQRLQRLGRILRRSENKGIAALYYIYVGASVENAAYLPGQQSISESFLRYLPPEDDFIHPSYEDKAAMFLEEIVKEKNPPADMIRELRTCIQEGMVRPDWRTPPEYCIERQTRATGKHLKNYWMCMEKLSRMQGASPENSGIA